MHAHTDWTGSQADSYIDGIRPICGVVDRLLLRLWLFWHLLIAQWIIPDGHEILLAWFAWDIFKI